MRPHNDLVKQWRDEKRGQREIWDDRTGCRADSLLVYRRDFACNHSETK